MVKNYNEYSLEWFPEQFRKACTYRGNTVRQTLSEKLSIREEQLQLAEAGVLQPDLKMLLAFANVLQLDLCYFFLPVENPQPFDLGRLNENTWK